MPLMPVAQEIVSPFLLVHVETVVPASTVSATLENVANMSVVINLSKSSFINAFASFSLQTASGASSSTIGLDISFDGSSGEEHQRFLSGTNDLGIGAIVERTDTALPAGNHTATLRFRRVSGTATPGIVVASMIVFAG